MTLSEHKHKFLPGIHGLRALAALSVLLFHQAPNLTLPAFAAPVASHGGMGVQLFFLLSAFSLVHSTQRRVGEPHWLGDYALKRCFRIVPLFYAAMVFFILHDRIIWEIWQPHWKIVLNASLLYALVPGLHQSIVWAGWTIGIETLFYILFPFLLVFAHGIWRRLLLLAVCVAVSLSYSRAAASLDSIEESYKYMNLLVFLPCFAAGMLSHSIFSLLVERRTPERLVMIGGVVCTIGFVAAARSLPPAYATTHGLLLWTGAFASLCVWQAYAPLFPVNNALFRHIGERSYSYYLTHAPIVFYIKPAYGAIYGFVGNDSLAYLLSVALGIACVGAVAALTYKLIEVPGIRYGSHLIRVRKN